MKNNTTIEFNEETCTLSYRRTPEYYPSKQKHTQVHISNPFDPEDFKDSGFTQQPEYSHKGEDKALDKEWRKYNKYELSIQKKIIDQAVSNGMLDESLAKELKWSRKAGCSCGCSPGWTSRDYRRQTIWLTVTSPSKEQEKKDRNRESLAKREEETLSSMVI
jgi:hypothetical protein